MGIAEGTSAAEEVRTEGAGRAVTPRDRLLARVRWPVAAVAAGLCVAGASAAFGWSTGDSARSESASSATMPQARLVGFNAQLLTTELGGEYGFHFMPAQAPADPGSVDIATAKDPQGDQMRVTVFGRAPEPVHGLVCEFTPEQGLEGAEAQAQEQAPPATPTSVPAPPSAPEPAPPLKQAPVPQQVPAPAPAYALAHAAGSVLDLAQASKEAAVSARVSTLAFERASASEQLPAPVPAPAPAPGSAPSPTLTSRLASAPTSGSAAPTMAAGFLSSCARLGAGEVQADAAANWAAQAQIELATAPAAQAGQGRLTAQAKFATVGYVLRLLPETGEWIMAITSAGP